MDSARWAIVIGLILFGLFIALMAIGTPIGVAMGLAAVVAIALSNLDTLWFGLLAVPQKLLRQPWQVPATGPTHVRSSGNDI